MPLTASKALRLTVSEDFLTASLKVNAEVAPFEMSLDDAMEQLHPFGLALSKGAAETIMEMLTAWVEGDLPEQIVIARGARPVHEQGGGIEKLYEQDLSAFPTDTAQSHYDRSKIVIVERDQPLLRIVHPVPGQDGVDVYGRPLAHKLARDPNVVLGVNVRQEGNLIRANCPGAVQYSDSKIFVEAKLNVPGDVDFSVGNINFPGDVIIAKNILDLFKVHSDANITVQGLIEAAEVSAGQDLNSTGGMAGKEKGRFTAGANINAKYITNAVVRAEHNVTASIEIVNCDLICGGSVVVESGSLVGGHTVAQRGAKVKLLGSEAGVKTLVEVGVNEEIRQKCLEYAPAITENRQKAHKVRQIVEPLLQNQKHLSAEQKTKATELLYQAYELEEQVEKMLSELRPALEDQENTANVKIEVLSQIFPSVTVRFPWVETEVVKPFKGPIKLMSRRVKRARTVIAVSSDSGSVQKFRSRPSSDTFWATLEELLAPPEEQ